MIYAFLVRCGWLLTRLLFRVEVHGKENLPKEGGYILVSNHLHAFDPVFLMTTHLRKICFLGKAELFRNWFTNWFFRLMGVIPVERGKGDMTMIQTAEETLDQGKVLGIFPEGTRSKDGTPGRPKSGTAHFAQHCKAGILPAAVTYPEKLRFRSRVRVSFGPFLPFEALGMTGETPTELKNATRIMWDAVLRLVDEGTVS